MKVLLLQDIGKVGRKHEIKEVADGYARNVLIPSGKAVLATADALARVGKLKENQAQAAERDEAAFRELIGKFDATPLVIKAKADAAGHLFAGLHGDLIVTEVEKHFGFKLLVSNLDLSKPIKEVGEHGITVKRGKLSGVLRVLVEKI